MSTATKEVTINTSQILDKKAIEFFLKNGLVSLKRSGAGISIKCAPDTERQKRDLECVKNEFKRTEIS